MSKKYNVEELEELYLKYYINHTPKFLGFLKEQQEGKKEHDHDKNSYREDLDRCKKCLLPSEVRRIDGKKEAYLGSLHWCEDCKSEHCIPATPKKPKECERKETCVVMSLVSDMCESCQGKFLTPKKPKEEHCCKQEGVPVCCSDCTCKSTPKQKIEPLDNYAWEDLTKVATKLNEVIASLNLQHDVINDLADSIMAADKRIADLEKTTIVYDEKSCISGMCPFAVVGGTDYNAWGMGPEGWEAARERHKKHNTKQ